MGSSPPQTPSISCPGQDPPKESPFTFNQPSSTPEPHAPPAAPLSPRTSAQSLVSRHPPSTLPDVFRRNLHLHSRRLASPSSSTTTSASTTPTYAAKLADNLRVSYAPSNAPSHSDDPRANAAAAKIQSAWHRYRILTSRSFSVLSRDALRLVESFISGRAFLERAASRAHLILHFDINKTILMSDAAKGAGQADMVNMLISECAWGRMTVGPQWIPVGRLATDSPEHDPQLMTYRNFLDSFLYPYVEGSTEEVHAENVRRKKLCGQLQRCFTAPGNPGEMFSGVFTALSQRLVQPESERGSEGFFASGHRRILPSFFELLLHLQATKRRFTVVFRTFGTDLAEVVHEMNMFATGRHPSYPGVKLDGSDGVTDLRLTVPASSGAFVRSGHSASDTVLALGVDKRVLEAPALSQSLLEENVKACGGTLLRGFGEIHRAFSALADPPTGPHAPRATSKASDSAGVAWLRVHRPATNCAIALRDHYHYWRSRNEFPRAGKLLLFDPSDANVMHMFFDDNIGHTSGHIADARDVRTGDSVPFAHTKNAQLNRAEPVNAILDPKFFIRAAGEAEMKILRSQGASQVPPAASAPFSGKALLALKAARHSGVARTSLEARHRWHYALRKVLIMCKVTRMFQQSIM